MQSKGYKSCGSGLKCMYVNARSVINKIEELCTEVQVIDPDIIAISESWANDSIGDSELNLVGYTLFRKDRALNIKGGGVLLYVREVYSAREVKLDNQFPEQVWCRVKCSDNRELFVGVCYRTPSENVYGHGMHDEVRKLITEISNRNFVLFGDFNYRGVDWALNCCDSSATVDAKLFLECVNDSFVTQHVGFLTTDKSILDLVFSKEPDLVCNVQELGNFGSSDHKLIVCNLDTHAGAVSERKTRFDYNRMDINGLRDELRLISWKSVLTGSVEDCWVRLKDILLDLRNKFVPVTVVKDKGKVPWMNYRALKWIKKKHRVFRKYKNSNHPACRRVSKIASRETKRAKYNFERKLAENIKKDTKSFYAYVKGKAKAGRNIGPLLNDQNEVVDSVEGMSQEFNRFFSSVFTKELSGEVPEAAWVYKESTSGLWDIEITEKKILDKLERLRDDKAAGADDLVPRFLNGIKEELVTPLGILFRKVLDEETVPRDWKEANVVPIFKGGQRSVVSNYRPVSLTSQICKVFEAIVRDEVVEFLDKHKLIRDSQHGFRKGRSCLTNLLLFLDQVLRSVDEGFCVDIVFLDLAKAFDKVPHRRLLEKVRKHGIGGKLLGMIGDWLRHRRQRVCIKGKQSDWEEVWSGVPQGSVLGPLLFLIFINDLEDNVSGNVLKFADDTKIFGQVRNGHDNIRMQADLDKFVEWADKWQMQFNVSKCKVMHVGQKNPGYLYNMGSNGLQRVDVEKDLGVMISSDLKCSQQCMYAYTKANRVMGMIRRTIAYKEPRIMLSLYKTLVRPHVEYCSCAWNPHYSKDKDLLEKIQHRFTKMIMNMQDKRYEDRLRCLGLWTLEERRNRQDLIEVFKMYRGFSNVSLHELFTVDENSKGTRGHSCKLVKTRCTRDITKYFFSNKVINRWNLLDQRTVDARTINAFKSCLVNIRDNRMGFFMD